MKKLAEVQAKYEEERRVAAAYAQIYLAAKPDAE